MKGVGEWLLLFLAAVALVLVAMNFAYLKGLRDGRESAPPRVQPNIDKQCMSWWFDGQVNVLEKKNLFCRGKA